MRARFEEVDLGAVTRDVGSMFRAGVEKTGLEFGVEVVGEVSGWVDVDM